MRHGHNGTGAKTQTGATGPAEPQLYRSSCSTTAITASKWPRPSSARNTALHDHVQEDQTRPVVVLPPELEASPPSKQRYGYTGPPPGTNQDHRKMISDASLHLLTVPLVSMGHVLWP